jgi:hypothetical protein
MVLTLKTWSSKKPLPTSKVRILGVHCELELARDNIRNTVLLSLKDKDLQNQMNRRDKRGVTKLVVS